MTDEHDCFLKFCPEHVEVQKAVSALQATQEERWENLEKAIQQTTQHVENIRKELSTRYQKHVLWVVTFLASALSIVTTCLINHLLKGN